MDKEKVLEQLMQVEDPELGIDIVTLGLIYEVKINKKEVDILMTLTFPGCPFGPMIKQNMTDVLEAYFEKIEINITFDPPWSAEKIDPDIRAALGI
ncbi:MAG: metal-sulfur cluster assembly factor [Candidatus Woesearchaeota archaeon]